MALAGILSEADIAAGLKSCEAKDTFNCKTFFAKVGLNTISDEEIREAFGILDKNKDGFLDRDELKKFMQDFSPEARELTEKEVTSLLEAVDFDGDGKIGFDEFKVFAKI
ncbi:parvalbumin beta-like [Hemicordylus capensis]|uniref:parvalbumin beta-like n=1 Tax=Hemicordylus capensis TaxID=884348 RepID=UPI002302663B|nr:parvalbumin beta-like [Hemicordylus capensis]XP_053133107.1 parvalbumin beta-like [Hemicordylus capensis]XP_053133108.1 parvalbumin beta-like [Hemicordylus capensis]XP_053133109.1 parvalbumin beta-like [Hemicordylus capensis]XP_053133110.1 parvalbumin beta-like [Hemicordylus capensis]